MFGIQAGTSDGTKKLDCSENQIVFIHLNSELVRAGPLDRINSKPDDQKAKLKLSRGEICVANFKPPCEWWKPR